MTVDIQKSKKALLWLCLAHLVCDIYTGFLNPIMPFIAAKLGFSMAVAAVLISISHICSNMLQPIFGFFADNILKRFFVFWGLVLVSIFIPLTTNAPNITLLLLFMIFGSLGGSFFHPQATGFTNIFSLRCDCADNMGKFISMGSVGFAFGPLVAALITQVLGLKMISWTSIMGLTLAALMFKFVPKLSLTEKKPEHKKFFKSFREILSNKQIDLLMIVSMMKSLVTNSCCILLPFLWKGMGYKPFYIGFALFLFVFAGAIGSFVSPKLEKILGSKVVIYISMCATFPMIVAFAYTYKLHPILSMLIFGITGFTTMLAQPVVIVCAQRVLPQYKSITAGFINGFCWGVVALCMSFLGAIAQMFGIMTVLVIVSIVPAMSSYFIKYLKDEC